MKRTLKIIACLSCLVLLNSCTIRLSYHLLDNIMMWELNQYASLKGQQKKDARQAIDDFHKWHRQTQLDDYADYLENLKSQMLAGPVSAKFLHKESDKLQNMLDVSADKILPSVTDVAATLSEDQIQQVLEKLKDDREEYRKDYIDADDEKIQKRRIRDLTRYIGGFFGRFTEEQKQRLIDWEDSLEPHEEFMIKQQIKWQAEFIEAMTFQDQPTELQARLRNLILYRTDNWDTELQRRLDVNQTLTFVMLADLFNSQTAKQKQKMERKFDQYIDDLRALAKRAES